MAKGKRISEQPILDALVGDELIPFAKNGANGAVEADTIKEYAQDGLDDKYADKSDTYTKSEVDGLVDGATSTAETTYAKKEDVPSKVSELENDSKFQTESEVDGKLADKVDKEDGKGLSSNDFTDEDKAKLDRFELVLADDDEIEDGLHQIASSEDYRSKLKENGYVVYHDVKYKVKDCGVTSDSYPWIITEGAVITANEDGTLNDHTQKNVVRSVYIWFDTILHYQPYNTSIPSKVSELTNDLKYTTETQVENSLAILYESLDSQLVDEYTHLDNKKVDKVTGKQLPTEDFTTILKQKLEGLTNYDDSTLTSELNALKSRLDTLVGSGDVTAVIDTFQEIEDFLQGITNTQTLTGLLQEMKSEIVALCADTYLPLNGGTINSTHIIPLEINTNAKCNYLHYLKNGVNKATTGYDATYGAILYNATSDKNMGIFDDGVPHYNGNTLWHAGNDGAGSGLDADLLDGKQPADLNVGSADKLTTKQLTNEDLNEIKDVNFSTYRGGDDNTCVNKPSNIAGFVLHCSGLNANYITQVIMAIDSGIMYKRTHDYSAWTPWKKMLTEDDIAPLITRIAALEARPTIASVDSLPSTPNNNTLYAIPE